MGNNRKQKTINTSFVLESALIKISFIILLIMNNAVGDQSQIRKGVEDSIQGSIQLMTGINALMAAGQDLTDPLNLVSIFGSAALNGVNSSSLQPILEELYEKYFLSNQTLFEGKNTTGSSHSTGWFKQLVSKLSNKISGSKSTNTDDGLLQTTEIGMPYENSDKLTKSMTTTQIMEMEGNSDHEIKGQFKRESNPEHEAKSKPDSELYAYEHLVNKTDFFKEVLKFHNNTCYELKNGIKSLQNSEMVILFMKFLEYDYLKAKESWIRLKATCDQIYNTLQTEHSDKIEAISTYIKETKNTIKPYFTVLKKPFSLIMKGIKSQIKNIGLFQSSNNDFCEQFYDAQIHLKNVIGDLEVKFNKTLDEKIKKQKDVLEEVSKNPNTMSYFDNKTISDNINSVINTINNTYIFFKNVSLNQLEKFKNM